jgi:hypothetical protein
MKINAESCQHGVTVHQICEKSVLPEVLILKINLFSSNTSKVEGADKMKLEKAIKIKLEKAISIFGIDFRLTGAVMHFGETTASGHYIALGEFFLSRVSIFMLDISASRHYFNKLFSYELELLILEFLKLWNRRNEHFLIEPSFACKIVVLNSVF